ncbi:MAG: helix-turn-helix transcriptional regulator [Clostridia bacterium]|nr:helix-turn-helix transcriptional regulator [Clostridia bacterium]
MQFAEKLREMRKQKGWSQEELAEKLGVSLRTIVNYEKGQTYPRNRKLYDKIAELFGINNDELQTETDEFMTFVGEVYGQRGQKQAQAILEEVGKLFAGGCLEPEDEIAFIQEVQQLYLDSKKRAKKFARRFRDK